LSPMKI